MYGSDPSPGVLATVAGARARTHEQTTHDTLCTQIFTKP